MSASRHSFGVRRTNLRESASRPYDAAAACPSAAVLHSSDRLSRWNAVRRKRRHRQPGFEPFLLHARFRAAAGTNTRKSATIKSLVKIYRKIIIEKAGGPRSRIKALRGRKGRRGTAERSVGHGGDRTTASSFHPSGIVSTSYHLRNCPDSSFRIFASQDRRETLRLAMDM